MSRFYLACLLGSTARREEARRVWGEMMAVNPGFSVEHLRRALPYRDPRLLDRVMAGLHEAGIAS
jgi:adenylate cyclase